MDFIFDELTVFVIVFLFLAVLIIFMGVKQVPQGEEYTSSDSAGIPRH